MFATSAVPGPGSAMAVTDVAPKDPAAMAAAAAPVTKNRFIASVFPNMQFEYHLIVDAKPQF